MWLVVLSLAWDMLRHWFVSYRSNAGSEASLSEIVKPRALVEFSRQVSLNFLDGVVRGGWTRGEQELQVILGSKSMEVVLLVVTQRY